MNVFSKSIQLLIDTNVKRFYFFFNIIHESIVNDDEKKIVFRYFSLNSNRQCYKKNENQMSRQFLNDRNSYQQIEIKIEIKIEKKNINKFENDINERSLFK